MSTFEVRPCIGDLPLCRDALVEQVTLVFFALFNILVNIMHLNVLSKIASLRKTPLLTVLRVHSLSEVMLSLMTVCSTCCKLHLMYKDRKCWSAIYTALATLSDSYSSFVLATFLVERNVSMYYSLRKKDIRLLKHIVWILVGEFLLLLAVVVLRDVIYYEYICFLPFKGASNTVHATPTLIYRVKAAVAGASILVSMLCLMYQINYVKYRQLTNVQEEALNGSKYAVLMAISHLIAQIPKTVCRMIICKYSAAMELRQAELLSIITQLIHGMICCVIYALVSRAYRKELVNSLRWFKDKINTLS